MLAAAVVEFSAHGFAGARIDRISTEAGVNKERIYPYFGGKAGLFRAALLDSLGDWVHEARIEGRGAEAIGRFAGELVDCYVAAPHLPRLLAWEGLEAPLVPDDERVAICADRIDGILSALPDLDRERAARLLLSILVLVNGSWTLPQLAAATGVARADHAALRASLVRQATALAEAT
nr:TetR family transcriptional regulator [Schumannella luteola]